MNVSNPDKPLTHLVRKARVRKALKARQGAEVLERVLDRRVDSTQALLRTDFEADESCAEEFTLMTLFHKMNDDYHRRSVPISPEMSKRAVLFWRRVLNAQQKSGVSAEVYLRAQFSYFHDTFGTAPKLEQLATNNAIMRAKEYAALKSQTKVFSNNTKFSIEMTELFKTCEKQLQQLQKVHKMSRVDVYKNFVLTGVVYFPKSFLDLDPAFAKAKT